MVNEEWNFKVKYLFIFILIFFQFTSFSLGATQVEFRLSSSKVAQGEPLTISAVVNGHKSAKPLQNQFSEGKIKAVYTGIVSETQIVNFKTMSSTTLNFTIIYNVSGNYKVPPITIDVDGYRFQIPDQYFIITKEKYQSAPNMIQKFFSLPTMEEDRNSKGQAEVKFHTSKSKVYIGEPIIGYYIFYHSLLKNPFFERNPNESISFPFFASELLSGVKINYPNIVALEKNGINQNYFTNPYNREIFALTPLKEGFYKLGKTKFDYSNSQQIHFFTESIEAIPKDINVIPLPINPPSSFSGEIGEFEVSTRINETEIQEGNIFKFSIRIEGKGLCNRLTDPLLKFIPNSFPGKIESLKIERNKKFAEINKDEYGFQCSAEFFYSLILKKNSKPFEVAISYFNPETESYVTKEISIPGFSLTKNKDNLSKEKSSKGYDFTKSNSSVNWKSIIIYSLIIIFMSLVIYNFYIRRKRNFILNSQYLDEIQKICGQKTGILLEKALLANGRSIDEAKFWKDIRKKYFDKEIANIFSILELREKEILTKFIQTGDKE